MVLPGRATTSDDWMAPHHGLRSQPSVPRIRTACRVRHSIGGTIRRVKASRNIQLHGRPRVRPRNWPASPARDSEDRPLAPMTVGRGCDGLARLLLPCRHAFTIGACIRWVWRHSRRHARPINRVARSRGSPRGHSTVRQWLSIPEQVHVRSPGLLALTFECQVEHHVFDQLAYTGPVKFDDP